MTKLGLGWGLCTATLALGLGCGSAYPSGYYVQGPSVVQTQTVTPGRYLYLPANNVPTNAVSGVVVQSSDGQRFELGVSDVHAALGGRMAVPLPMGVSDGTASLTVNGQLLSIPFHVVVGMTPAPVLGSYQPTLTDSRCAAIMGTWQGTIWSTPGSTATVSLQIFGDCRTVQGLISAASPGFGSVESTIEGVWDVNSATLVARDTQLFNIRPANGSSFCETVRYELHLVVPGVLQGTNDTSSTSCGHIAQVYLRRVG